MSIAPTIVVPRSFRTVAVGLIASALVMSGCDINIVGPEDDSGASAGTTDGDGGDGDDGDDDGGNGATSGAGDDGLDEDSDEGGADDQGDGPDEGPDDGPDEGADDGADDGPGDGPGDGPADGADEGTDGADAGDGPGDEGGTDGDTGAGDDGIPGCQDDDPVDEAMCIDAAPMVPGCEELVACACDNCGCLGLECADDPDCQPIRDCALLAGCSGFDCYSGGACTAVIDAHGGAFGAGAAMALELEACVMDSGCGATC